MNTHQGDRSMTTQARTPLSSWVSAIVAILALVVTIFTLIRGSDIKLMEIRIDKAEARTTALADLSVERDIALRREYEQTISQLEQRLSRIESKLDTALDGKLIHK